MLFYVFFSTWTITGIKEDKTKVVYKINICGKVTCNQKEADFCYDDQALTSAAKNFFYDGKTVTFWFILTVKIAIVANRQSFSHPFGISSAYVWRLLWFLVLSNQSEFKMFCRWNQTVSKDLTWNLSKTRQHCVISFIFHGTYQS